MKKPTKKPFPLPQKKIKTAEDLKDHIETLFNNALKWLQIDGYNYWILLPTDKDWKEHENSALSITVQYPYKRFIIYVQKPTLEQALNLKPGEDFFWKNLENGVFHECIHILVWRIRQLAGMRYVTPTDLNDEEESLVDYFTNIICRCVSDSRKKKKV